MSNSRNAFRYMFMNMPQVSCLTLKKENDIKRIFYPDTFISDLSATGCCIESNEEINFQNSFLYVESLINNKKYNWKTKVIWNKKTEDNKYKYGLQFLQNIKEEQENLKLIYSMQTKKRN